MIYTYDEICDMPTISEGHTCNLKYDDGQMRIWKSRMTIQDGELHPIQVERLENGRWVDVTCSTMVAQGQICRAAVNGPNGRVEHI